MCAYQVLSRPSPVETMTSHCPDQLWSVRMMTVPSVTARTGVPHAAERSSPVWAVAQWSLR